MQEAAIYYFVVAWLGCLTIDLVVAVARGPLLIESILKLVVVLACLIIVLVVGSRHSWVLLR